MALLLFRPHLHFQTHTSSPPHWVCHIIKPKTTNSQETFSNPQTTFVKIPPIFDHGDRRTPESTSRQFRPLVAPPLLVDYQARHRPETKKAQSLCKTTATEIISQYPCYYRRQQRRKAKEKRGGLHMATQHCGYHRVVAEKDFLIQSRSSCINIV